MKRTYCSRIPNPTSRTVLSTKDKLKSLFHLIIYSIMRKFSLFISVMLLQLAFHIVFAHDHPVKTDAQKSTSMRIGYTEGSMNLNLGSGITFVIKGAIQFPASYMERLKGGKITVIRLAIGDELSEQDNNVFITDHLEGTPLYSQKVERLNRGWNEIVLDTPFEITGEEIFIGFKYKSSGEVISFDGKNDNNYANWLAHAQLEDELAWTHQSGGCLNLQAIVSGDNLPQNDISLNEIRAKKYAHPGMGTPVDLIVKNMAAADIHSLEVTYTVEDQDPVTTTIDNLSIKNNELGIASLGDIIINQNGIYNLSVKVNKVNGENDEDPVNNEGTIENIICKADYTNRKVLLEQFSTMKCINCPNAHKVLEDALKFKRDIIRVVHHAGYDKDTLTLTESEKYLFFYFDEKGGNYYAPGMMLDRTNLTKYGADNGSGGNTPGPAFFPRLENASKLIDQSLSTPALITLELDSKYDAQTRFLKISASGQIPSGSVERLNGDNICLNLFLTEDSILGTQSGAENPNEYYHSHALRKVITSLWGDPIEFTGDEFHSKEYTFTIPEEWIDKRMHVIAFIANSDPISSNNCKVYNSEETSVVDSQLTSIESIQNKSDMKIYTAFGDLYIQGEYTSAAIYNINGCWMKEIDKTESKINIKSLPAGVYLIKLNTQKGSGIFKFVVK